MQSQLCCLKNTGEIWSEILQGIELSIEPKDYGHTIERSLNLIHSEPF